MCPNFLKREFEQINKISPNQIKKSRNKNQWEPFRWLFQTSLKCLLACPHKEKAEK